MTYLPIIAYTTPTQAAAVAWATRTTPMTSPPVEASDPALMRVLLAIDRPHVLYLALHGYRRLPNLCGEGTTALTPEMISPLRLPGSVIFAPCCWLTDSPMLDCLLETGAVVIAGAGPNWSPFVHVLGRHLITFMRLRLAPGAALRVARARLALHSDHPHALDTLALRLFTPPSLAPVKRAMRGEGQPKE